MKIIRTFAIAIAVALVDCVSHAGLFDTIKSVANEAANVADEAAKITETVTKPAEAAPGQIQTSTSGQVNAEENNHSATERRGNPTMTFDEQAKAQKKQVYVTHEAQFKVQNMQRTDGQNEASEGDRDFVAFVNQLGAKAVGPTNVFVGVEVYKGVRLGMTESAFHKIETSDCSDAQFCGKNLQYPSVKKNTIAPSGGAIPVIDVYLGGLDLNKSPDESRKNFIVTRVEFTIKNAAQTPGISAIEKQFADRFGGTAQVERTIRKMPRGVSAAAAQDPKVQKASAKVAKYRRKAEEYMQTKTTPPEKFMAEFKEAEAEADAAISPYAIVEKYPVTRLALAGQIVELTQPNLTQDIQVTAVYEVAESELAKLRLALEEKSRKENSERAKKEALDF